MDCIVSMYIKNYKCFRERYFGIKNIKPINIIIGRNNTGKSSLADMFEFICNKDEKLEKKDILLSYKLPQDIISNVFRSDTSGGIIVGNHASFGVNYIGKEMMVKLSYAGNVSRNTITGKFTNEIKTDEFDDRYSVYWDQVAEQIVGKIRNYSILKVSAERNIISEEDNSVLSLSWDGTGATNIVHKFINHSSYDSKLVEKDLLNDLNKIMFPDTKFNDIVVQQRDINGSLKWEIYLEDEYNGRIALSESGSGLKTIMLVLINLILIPELKGIDRKNIIYIFEELENNLHPALQRNLFKYISRKCLQEESKVIFTTHSHVPINMFAGKEEASITHIINRNNQIEVKEVLDYIECNDILKDLDVKASDLLQSNGIVWVEGPSDRVYLNKWIDMFSNGELKEGQHYQILFYGGRLLSHLSAKDEDKEKSESSKLIQLLLTNRNSAIVIDSDKREENAQVNSTKLRIKEEFENYKSFVWITEGKEIENYIPEEILREKYSIDGQDKFEQYDIIQTFLNQKKRTETVNLGDWFVGHKVSFANEILDLMTYENLKDVLDLETKINELITYIKSWN